MYCSNCSKETNIICCLCSFGRRRFIATMAENSVPDVAGMAYAGIKSARVYRGYVAVHCNKLRSQLKDFDRKSSFGKALKTK